MAKGSTTNQKQNQESSTKEKTKMFSIGEMISIATAVAAVCINYGIFSAKVNAMDTTLANLNKSINGLAETTYQHHGRISTLETEFSFYHTKTSSTKKK